MDKYYSTKDEKSKTITLFERIEGESDKVLAQLEYGNEITKMKERDADQLMSEILQALNPKSN